MTAETDNMWQAVQTLQPLILGALQNVGCFVNTADTRYKDFQSRPANLGDTIKFRKPYRVTTSTGLEADFQDLDTRYHELTIDQTINSAVAMDAEELIEYVDNDNQTMDIVKSMAVAIGEKVESNIAANFESAPYRFFGDGLTPINDYSQLSQALADFRTIGMPGNNKGYLVDTSIPAIVKSGLNEFAPSRNDRIADTWMLENYDSCAWYRSNLIKTHIAGTEGNEQSVLTVVSVVTDANNAVISITFGGTNATNDPESIKLHDNFKFLDDVPGLLNIRELTYNGYEPTSSPVQFRATNNAASTGGSQVTVDIFPPLQAAAGNTQNISREIAVGMQCKVLPSHKCGGITSNNALYYAMAGLPSTYPFPYSRKLDEKTGVGMRCYHGEIFSKSVRGLICDAAWASTAVPEYIYKIVQPL